MSDVRVIFACLTLQHCRYWTVWFVADCVAFVNCRGHNLRTVGGVLPILHQGSAFCLGYMCISCPLLQLVIHCSMTAEWSVDLDSNCSCLICGYQQARNLQFLYELRRLFALMVASKRKYVDPSKPVEILKEAFSCGTNNSFCSSDNQQVSLFSIFCWCFTSKMAQVLNAWWNLVFIECILYFCFMCLYLCMMHDESFCIWIIVQLCSTTYIIWVEVAFLHVVHYFYSLLLCKWTSTLHFCHRMSVNFSTSC